MVLNINSDAVIRHTATLERLHRSALPVAIRSALNSAAFDVKTKTMPIASNVFVHRSPTFFPATSKVNPAKGFNINEMAAIVGFLPSSGAKEKGGATKNLEQQEHGGQIQHRAFIPLKQARSGGNYNRNVSAKNRLAEMKAKGIIDTKTSMAKTKAGKFFSSAFLAGKGGLVIGTDRHKGLRMLMRINSIHREGGRTFINSTPLYSVKSGRAVKVKTTKFMQKASLESAKKMEQFYMMAAEKQIARLK